MRVVADANVFVSAALGRSPDAPSVRIISAALDAISYFIAAGLDWKQISTWAGHGDVRQTWNRYGHLLPGGEDAARERLDAFLTPTRPTPTVAHALDNDETPNNTGF